MSPLEFFKSDYMNNMRKDMLNHVISDDIKFSCSQCILNERNGMSSRRMNKNQEYNTEDTLKTIENFLNRNNKILETDLQYVNLKLLGNICNLKCIMCNPNSSSKIASEYKKYNIQSFDQIIKTPYNKSNKEKYFSDIFIILENINRFSLIGGEAFIHPDFQDIFEMIISNTNANNISLFIITNGTKIPQYVLDSANKFNKLEINFSIDGISSRAEYIRSGTIWKEFDRNLKRTLSSDAEVGFTVAIQALNIGYLDEIYDYITSLDYNINGVGWNNLVTYPYMHNAINLPLELKKMYIEKYSGHPISQTDNNHINNTLAILKKDQHSEKHFNDFILFNKKLDKIRGTKLIDVFPEFTEYYNDC